MTVSTAAVRRAAWSLAEDGWHVGLISLLVYILTLAPGITLWDSGEFILCGAQVDVGHPPGAPFYWLILRTATMIAPHGYEGLACNIVSAVCMSTASMVVSLVFRELALWTDGGMSRRHLLIGQTTGGLSFALADSVWSLGVETEVYGAAVLIASATIWLALRWRRTGSWRSLALAAYVSGLAIGVHWLAWLALPSAACVVGSRHGKRGMLAGLAVGMVWTYVSQWQASGHIFDLGALLDVFAVNSLGLPVGTGLTASTAIVFTAFFLLATLSKSQRLRTLAEIALLSQLGSLAYAVPLLRSQSGVAISVGSPSDAFGLTDYMGRKQYGESHLLCGPTYASKPDGVKTDITMQFDKQTWQYVPHEVATEYSYHDSCLRLFPRMVNADDTSLFGYADWGVASALRGEQPTLGESLLFVARYQIGHMFCRYWLWNFFGREGDSISAFNPLKERNETLWGLPMLVALAGCVSLTSRGRRRAGLVVLTLWGMGGIVLALYLNMQPYEPRERDYIFILSYMATAIMIAYGATAIMPSTSRSKWLRRAAEAVPALVLALMLWQNMPTHDRSRDTLVEETAISLLRACPDDAMLVVYGDNETYSLWYAQQVLRVRRDVRVVNSGLLGQPWYVDQLTRPGREDKPLAFPNIKAVKDGGVMLFLSPESHGPTPLSKMKEVGQNETGSYFIFPSDSIRIATSQDSVTVRPYDKELGTEDLSLLAIIDANPARPVCFVAGSIPNWDNIADLVYDIGPIAYLTSDIASMQSTRAMRYKAFNLPDATRFNMTDDEEGYLGMLRIRRMSNDVAEEALQEGNINGCREALRRSLAWLPKEKNTDDTELIRLGGLLAQAGERRMAREVLQEVVSLCANNITRAAIASRNDMAAAQQILDNNAELLEPLLEALDRSGNHDLTASIIELAQSFDIEL